MIRIGLRISTKKNSILIPKFYNNPKKNSSAHSFIVTRYRYSFLRLFRRCAPSPVAATSLVSLEAR